MVHLWLWKSTINFLKFEVKDEKLRTPEIKWVTYLWCFCLGRTDTTECKIKFLIRRKIQIQEIYNPLLCFLVVVLKSISPTFCVQLFRNKSFAHSFFCTYIFRFVLFGTRISAQQLLLKCWWNWHRVKIKLLEQKVIIGGYSRPSLSPISPIRGP